jgi:hypothetical protein
MLNRTLAIALCLVAFPAIAQQQPPAGGVCAQLLGEANGRVITLGEQLNAVTAERDALRLEVAKLKAEAEKKK